MANILIVDNDSDARHEIENPLVERGHSISVDNGDLSGLSARKIKQLHVAIVDMMLYPDEKDPSGGLKTIRKLREASEDLLIIAISSFATNRLSFRALSSGADYFLERTATFEHDIPLLQDMINESPKRKARNSRLGMPLALALASAGSYLMTYLLGRLNQSWSMQSGLAFFVIYLLASGYLKWKAQEVAEVLKSVGDQP